MKRNHNFRKKTAFFIFGILGLTLFFQKSPAFAEEAMAIGGTMPVKEAAKHLEDRSYLEEIRKLIALAGKTIDISQSELYVGNAPGDSAARILGDLIAASKRGVKVRIFVSPFNQAGAKGDVFLREDKLSELRHGGVEVHFVNPDYVLYDRLVVIDSNVVLEGGPPWISGPLETGLASTTLIQSEALARKKITRLEFLPLWDVEAGRIEIAEGRVAIPFFLLRELEYFPSMVKQDDGDAMKIYLALLRIFYQVKDMTFMVEPRDLIHEIPADRYFEESAVLKQVFKIIDRLQNEYRLLEIKGQEPAKLQIRLTLPLETGPVIGVPVSFFQENYAKDLSPEAIFAYFVILRRSQASGESPVWLGSEHNVEQDFPVEAVEFRMGVDELRRKNLIEVFPFKLNPEAPAGESTEYRYLLNPITTLSEKLNIWARLRDQFGDDHFKQAKDLAEQLGEPEDPKAVAVYLKFLDQYPAEDILGYTQHLAMLPPLSTPARLDYLQTLLEHESRGSLELATRS